MEKNKIYYIIWFCFSPFFDSIKEENTDTWIAIKSFIWPSHELRVTRIGEKLKELCKRRTGLMIWDCMIELILRLFTSTFL